MKMIMMNRLMTLTMISIYCTKLSNILSMSFVHFRKMLDANIFDLVDKFYGEFHPYQNVTVSKEFQKRIHQDLKKLGESTMHMTMHRT